MITRPIQGFSSYEITKTGKVWSHISNRWLKPRKNSRGYLYVNLYRNKRAYSKRIHRLVLETFVGPCPDVMECRHLNGNTEDNRLSNLCWGTHQENIQDAIKHGTSATFKKGANHNQAKLTEQDVKQIFNAYWDGAYEQAELAKHFDVTIRTISCIINKITWKHILI